MSHPSNDANALTELDALVSQHVEAILRAARAAPPGGGRGWDEILAHYRVPPEGPAARLLEARRIGLRAGAIPTEVRRALEAMAAGARDELHRRASPGDPRAREVETHLAALPAEETRRYEAAMTTTAAIEAPKAGVASIFANALETSKQVPWAKEVLDPTSVLACAACGAPQERSTDFHCRYCGKPIAG